MGCSPSTVSEVVYEFIFRGQIFLNWRNHKYFLCWEDQAVEKEHNVINSFLIIDSNIFPQVIFSEKKRKEEDLKLKN